MYYDQAGTAHQTETLAVLANVWDYDQSAMHEDAYYLDLTRNDESAAEWLDRFRRERNLSDECYAPGHACSECIPF